MRETWEWKFRAHFSYVNSKIDRENSDCKPFYWPFNHRFNTQAEGDPEVGAEKISVGVACHGKDGNATTELHPNLASQPAVYLENSLKPVKKNSDKGNVEPDDAQDSITS